MKKNQNYSLYIFTVFSSVYFLICFSFKYFVHNISLNNFILDFYLVKNTGAAFSAFEGFNRFLAVFAALVSFGVVCWVVKNRFKIAILGLQASSFLLAGICSNMTERFLDGYVSDYIRLRFIDFPIFNLADIFINIGVILFVCLILFEKREINE